MLYNEKKSWMNIRQTRRLLPPWGKGFCLDRSCPLILSLSIFYEQIVNFLCPFVLLTFKDALFIKKPDFCQSDMCEDFSPVFNLSFDFIMHTIFAIWKCIVLFNLFYGHIHQPFLLWWPEYNTPRWEEEHQGGLQGEGELQLSHHFTMMATLRHLRLL